MLAVAILVVFVAGVICAAASALDFALKAVDDRSDDEAYGDVPAMPWGVGDPAADGVLPRTFRDTTITDFATKERN